MNRKPNQRTRLLSALVGAIALCVGIAPAFAAGAAHGRHHRCERQFEVAQRMDMESFRDYDEDVFRAGHTDDAVTVFASGARFIGIDAIMNALSSHFTNREAIWEWTEIYRSVQGCDTAFILYETWYSIPSSGFRQRALTAVSYTYDRRQRAWLSVADTGTLLPLE